MQRKYSLAYFVFALGLTTLTVGVDAQAKIAFVSDRDGHSWEIYVMDDDGGNPRRLTNSPEEEFDPSWSPDGKRIVFWSESHENQRERGETYLRDGRRWRELSKTHQESRS